MSWINQVNWGANDADYVEYSRHVAIGQQAIAIGTNCEAEPNTVVIGSEGQQVVIGGVDLLKRMKEMEERIAFLEQQWQEFYTRPPPPHTNGLGGGPGYYDGLSSFNASFNAIVNRNSDSE